jgi:transposase
MGVKTIAKRLGIARNTVRAAVRSTDPPAYRRSRRSSAVDAFEPEIRKLLKDCPTMPATVIAERVSWERGISVLKERERKQRVSDEARNGAEVSVEERNLSDYDQALGVA